jgi:hypothetical protein
MHAKGATGAKETASGQDAHDEGAPDRNIERYFYNRLFQRNSDK